MNIEQQEIINHALSSKENLHIAVAVGKTYNELREFLIREFSKYLEQKLKEKEWETNFSYWNDKPLGSYSGFTVRKENWQKNIVIALEPQTKGEANYIIGIIGKKSNVAEPLRKDLFNKCNEVISHGSQSAGWIWYKYVLDEYRNFDNADTLFTLYEKEKFAAYLLAEIEKLGDVVDSELVKINPLY